MKTISKPLSLWLGILAILQFLSGGTGLQAQTASSIYLQLEGIPGESVAKGHENWILVKTFDWEWTHPKNAKTKFGDIKISKSLDRASALLAQKLATGKSIRSATLHFTKQFNSQVLLYSLVLSNVFVTQFAQALTNPTDLSDPSKATFEEFSFSYSRMEWTVRQYDVKGSFVDESHSYWDLLTNTGGNALVPAVLTVQASAQTGCEVSWIAAAGQAYALFASPGVDKPFVQILEIPAGSGGPTSRTFPFTTAFRFFRLQSQ